ncbi:serine/threonine-protein kinase [Streptomyces sp. NBC_01352]|uniref:serine/threonine-protein kinase n=1 Tax=unclassified Streptomyces TaxID=2593676 RepID=UPI00224DE0C0|nr:MULTISPECIES: serine/threonine-protein kinase [unclassified Streptomyces]MCX4698452.1 serine/threonine-protein kinase [Streptomyces sp. NBC_01373]
MTDERHPTPSYTPASGDAALKQAGATPLQPADPGRIGPYVALGRLGSGGMGRVYLARPADDSPGLAAVKVIRPEYAENADFRRRFEREAAVHGRVGAPHAPRLLGSGFEDSLLWMATEYLPGLNLADAVRECGPLEPPGMWRLVAELGQALSALAAAGVVHRDLKPSNVILSSQGAQVIDFGISQAADSSAITTTGNRVGTPAFMSPEYLREGRCDTISDVFSLAGSLVYAATGHAPFGDGTGVDVMHRVAFEQPRAEIMTELSAADPALAALLAACLEKDPAGRPTPQQLIDAATAAGYDRAAPWQEPLATRLLSRQQGCELLEDASAEDTGHFRPPTWGVAAPAPAPAYGAPTPSEQHGGPGTPVQYAPSAHPSGEHGARRRRKSRLLALTAGLAVVAVAAGAFFLTRPDLDEAASVSPTASTASSADAEAASAPPTSSGSPSATKGTETTGEKGEVTDEESEKADSAPPGSTGEAQPAPDDDPTATSGSGGSGSGSNNGGGSTPTPTPTKTAAKPATPPWISQCTYYSGTELTTFGDKGQRVVQVQCMLTKRGYSVGGSGVDGQFGEDTESAVRLFQSDKGLEVDGDVGPNTWAGLRSST